MNEAMERTIRSVMQTFECGRSDALEIVVSFREDIEAVCSRLIATPEEKLLEVSVEVVHKLHGLLANLGWSSERLRIRFIENKLKSGKPLTEHDVTVNQVFSTASELILINR